MNIYIHKSLHFYFLRVEVKTFGHKEKMVYYFHLRNKQSFQLFYPKLIFVSCRLFQPPVKRLGAAVVWHMDVKGCTVKLALRANFMNDSRVVIKSDHNCTHGHPVYLLKFFKGRGDMDGTLNLDLNFYSNTCHLIRIN